MKAVTKCKVAEFSSTVLSAQMEFSKKPGCFPYLRDQENRLVMFSERFGNAKPTNIVGYFFIGDLRQNLGYRAPPGETL